MAFGALPMVGGSEHRPPPIPQKNKNKPSSIYHACDMIDHKDRNFPDF